MYIINNKPFVSSLALTRLDHHGHSGELVGSRWTAQRTQSWAVWCAGGLGREGWRGEDGNWPLILLAVRRKLTQRGESKYPPVKSKFKKQGEKRILACSKFDIGFKCSIFHKTKIVNVYIYISVDIFPVNKRFHLLKNMPYPLEVF